ncbi:hypothetical protein QCA50_001303 [Cerrena zonata]|uniref:DUF7719 domain-containing protein n=1 Tax=Cerrena zonata TaxID=2478898 RepID=A0AAW0GTQ2_9APHY
MGKNKRPSKQKAPTEPQEPLVDIPEMEQWRIIQESGILNKIKKDDDKPASTKEDDEEGKLSPLAEEIFSAINLIIPICFVLLMMDILIHYQYGRHPTYGVLLERMVPSVPILSVFIFYTSRYKFTRQMQAFLFVLSLGTGTRLIWLINTASWITNMKQVTLAYDLAVDLRSCSLPNSAPHSQLYGFIALSN